jgi:hypothetical protein
MVQLLMQVILQAELVHQQVQLQLVLVVIEVLEVAEVELK